MSNVINGLLARNIIVSLMILKCEESWIGSQLETIFLDTKSDKVIG